jgi:putative transposase
LYTIRQYYFSTGKNLPWDTVVKDFRKNNQEDFRKLPSKVACHTVKLVGTSYKSFFKLVKSGRKANIPKYLDKLKGRQVIHYEKGALSLVKEGYISLSGTTIQLKTDKPKDRIQFVRIVPKNAYYVVEIGYNEEVKFIEDSDRIASIDLGVNNLATLTTNTGLSPLIINGRPLKYINHHYNKVKSKLQSDLQKQYPKRRMSNRIRTLTYKRNNRINNYLHKASRLIVNYLVSNKITTLVIGYNKGWKQSITSKQEVSTDVTKQNNQNFHTIPFYKFIQLLSYKCEISGIEVVIREESYTSLCSFLDNEDIKKHKNYKGERIKRGLFRSHTGKYINADVNASFNIMKKYLLSRKEIINISDIVDFDKCNYANPKRINICYKSSLAIQF